MALDIVYSNVFAEEDTASTTETLTTFPTKSRVVSITNDDASIDILVRFSTDHAQMTVAAGETLGFDMRANGIYIDAASGTPAYRLRVGY